MRISKFHCILRSNKSNSIDGFVTHCFIYQKIWLKYCNTVIKTNE